MKATTQTIIAVGIAVALSVPAVPIAGAPPSHPSSDHDTASLARLIGSTRAICDDPNTFGYSVSGSAQAGASATIPKLLGKLFSFGLSGSLDAAGEQHGGIAQKDVGPLRTAQVQCRENVFADLNRRGTFTDLSTGRRVPKISNSILYFRSHQETAAQSQIDNNTVGNGSAFVGGSVGGNVTINNGPASGAITNKDKIIALANFIKQANALESGFVESNDVEAVKSGYADWSSRVDAYLTASFDPSYSATFEAASPTDGLGLIGHSVDGNSYWSLLRAKNAVLTSAVAELRR